MRIVRVVLAAAILIQSWYAKDSTTAVFGVLLLTMGVFDMGCCGAGSCYTPLKRTIRVPIKNLCMKKWFKNNTLLLMGAVQVH